jgi:hypothetical protein
MKAILLPAAFGVAVTGLALSSTPAPARGCLKGAVVGGVAGHFAGHHGLPRCKSAPNQDPAGDWSSHIDSNPNNQRFGGVPIGADQDPPVQRILDVESRW